ncbi:hypothetical protein [Nocardia concava]|nr:hypothetical protein [Nocardia concava]
MPVYSGSGFTDLLLAISHLILSGSSTSITQPGGTTTTPTV